MNLLGMNWITQKWTKYTPSYLSVNGICDIFMENEDLQEMICMNYIQHGTILPFNTTRLENENTTIYSIIWQIGPLCHNNEVFHENTHFVVCHMYKINILSNLFTNMQKYTNISWNLCRLQEVINSTLMLAIHMFNEASLIWATVSLRFQE